MRITGTFLDEITHDIPSANWGEPEWAADFDAMRAVGIDTVILIRAGYRDRLTMPSAALSAALPMRPCYVDLVDLFLTQAERTGMTFYFGLYDSGRFWHAFYRRSSPPLRPQKGIWRVVHDPRDPRTR
jgi:hypothetical protein